MNNKKESKKNNSKIQFSNSFKDLVIIGIITVTVFILSYFFDVFIFLVRLFQKYPFAITYIDEIIMLLLTLSIGFAIFSWRRWLELRKETAERQKLQEELINQAKTQAEIERIISKQLHIEIEQRKQEEKKKLK